MIPWQTLHSVGQLMREGELKELEWENNKFEIMMSKTGSVPAAPPAAAGETKEKTSTTGSLPVPEGAPDPNWIGIESPMVGTFYKAPAPDAGPFVDPGDRVSYETTVCIIEAMKLMNEIEAETEGTIEEVCIEDGESVSKGDVLFYVDPS